MSSSSVVGLLTFIEKVANGTATALGGNRPLERRAIITQRSVNNASPDSSSANRANNLNTIIAGSINILFVSLWEIHIQARADARSKKLNYCHFDCTFHAIHTSNVNRYTSLR